MLSQRLSPPCWWHGVSIVLVVLVVMASFAPVVSAHAHLSESDPANGQQLDDPPTEITLTFSGDGVQLADVSVTGPAGDEVGGDAVIDPDDTRSVSVPVDPAGEGVYVVEWEVLADDGHTTRGTFFFSVGDDLLDRDTVLAAYEDDDVAAGSPAEMGAKAFVLLALVGLVGIPISTRVVVSPVTASTAIPQNRIDRPTARLLAGTAILLSVSVLALGLARSASLGTLSVETVGRFVGTPVGGIWVVQLSFAVVVTAVLVAGVRGLVSRQTWWTTALVGGGLVLATVGWTSHSATAIDRLLGTAIDFAHVGGAGLWVGGLVVLSVVVPRLLAEADPARRAELAAETVRRFSIVALSGVTIAVTAGLLLAAWHVPSLEALGETLYGIALSTKTLLVLVAFGLGGFTRFVLLRRLESGGSTLDAVAETTRAVRVEVAVLVLVVLLSGLLTTVPTAAVAGADGGPPQATVERSVDELVVDLSAIPAEQLRDTVYVREGELVVFEVEFLDGDERLSSDRPVQLFAHNEWHGVTMEMELERTADGTFAVVQALPETGSWEVRISGMIDGTYVSEWFDVYVVPDHPAHDGGHDHDHGAAPTTTFSLALQAGAILVGIVGIVAVTVETVRFGRRENE